MAQPLKQEFEIAVEAAPPSPRWSAQSWVVGGVLLILLGFAYSRSLAWMVMRWPLEPYSGGGFMIPPIVAYLVWMKREDLAALPRKPSAWGIPILVLALCLYLLGSWTGINYPYALSFLVTVWGMVFLLLGWSFVRELAFPMAFLFFMLPLSYALDPLIFPLRLLATKMASWLPIALGMPTTVNGTDIHVGSFSLLVDLPCSGIRYVLALMAGAALFAHLMSTTLWRKIAVFALAMPVAVLTNVMRIDLTLLLGKTFGPAAAQGFFHEFSGVFVFVFALICLLYASRWVSCSSGHGL